MQTAKNKAIPRHYPVQKLLVKNRWRQLRQRARFARCLRSRESQIVLFADATEGGLGAYGSFQNSAAPNTNLKPTRSLIEGSQNRTPPQCIDTGMSCRKIRFELALFCGAAIQIFKQARKRSSFRSLGRFRDISYRHLVSVKGSELWAPVLKVGYGGVITGL